MLLLYSMRMLDSIGGEENVTKVYKTEKDRLELRFWPEDVHSHSVFGGQKRWRPACYD